MDRFSFRSALAGGLVAAMVMTALPVLAGVGDAIILGVKNTGNAETEIQGSESGPLVRFDNNHNNGKAARFEVVAQLGNPPFSVNSGAKVKKLNVDRVDGFSASQLTRVAFDSTDDAADANGNAVSTSITIPKDGWLILSGSIDGFGDTLDAYICRLTVDGATVAGTLRVSAVDDAGGDHTINNSENCSTTGVHPVTGGTNLVVALTISSRGTVLFNAATVWALYVPFDGQGNRP